MAECMIELLSQEGVTGRGITLPAGYEVLETTGDRIELCIDAHLHHVRVGHLASVLKAI
jgi:hypothetical protein